MLASRSSAATACMHSKSANLCSAPGRTIQLASRDEPECTQHGSSLAGFDKVRTVRCVLTLALGHAGAQRAGGPVVVRRTI